MSGSGSMRRVWMGVTLAIAAISAWPAWANHISWWMPGTAIALFLVLALEPWFLTWQLRRRGEELRPSRTLEWATTLGRAAAARNNET